MGNCFICDRFKFADGRKADPTVERTSDFERNRISCPRCGVYIAARDWYEDTPHRPKPISEAAGLRVSRLIREHNDQNKRPPFLITHESFDALEKQEARKLSYSGYVERLLLQLAGATSYPGLQSSPVALEVLAARAELPGLVVAQILTQMREQGHFMVVNGEYDSYVVRLLPAGWARVDELQASRPRSDRAFVAMWFDKSMTEAYADGIESALLACGYEKPFRVDDIAHQAEADKPGFQLKIDDRIIAGIRQARFVVADVTGQRPAVYYEAGFAEGLGTPVIWACREDVLAHMNFDTRQKEHILWADPGDLKTKLETKIRARGWDRR